MAGLLFFQTSMIVMIGLLFVNFPIQKITASRLNFAASINKTGVGFNRKQVIFL
jgi:hypothetical protein